MRSVALRKRLEALEAQSVRTKTAPGWTPEKMTEKVIDELDFAATTNSPVYLSRYELELLGVEDPRELPDRVRDLVRIHPTGYGFIAKRYADAPEEPFESWREKVRKHRELVQAFVEESRRRDAALIARNRKACGLLPLEEDRGA